VDRLAATLGIHSGSIKIVGVYEGSIIMKYDIIIEEIAGPLAEEPEVDVDEAEPVDDTDTEDDADKEDEDGDTIVVVKPLT